MIRAELLTPLPLWPAVHTLKKISVSPSGTICVSALIKVKGHVDFESSWTESWNKHIYIASSDLCIRYNVFNPHTRNAERPSSSSPTSEGRGGIFFFSCGTSARRSHDEVQPDPRNGARQANTRRPPRWGRRWHRTRRGRVFATAPGDNDTFHEQSCCCNYALCIEEEAPPRSARWNRSFPVGECLIKSFVSFLYILKTVKDTVLGRQAKLFIGMLSLENKVDNFRSATPPYQLSEELKVR